MSTFRKGRREFLKTGSFALASMIAQSTVRSAYALVPGQQGAKLTMLNSTASPDFELAVERHVALGLQWLDLKDAIWGETINDISLQNAERVLEIARAHRLGIWSFSTALCSSNIEEGETAFRRRHFARLDHILKLAEVLQPQSIRLVSANVYPLPQNEPVIAYVERRHPWIFAVYSEMVDRIVASGRRCLIENEFGILDRVESVLRFFERLRHRGRAYFTWDVQNLWQTGVFPTLEVYRQLKPLMGCIHLKGGRSEDGNTLVWASALEDASWPVTDIIRAVVADGVVPVICLNPSHGVRARGYSDWRVVQQDVSFLRREVSADL